MTSQIAPAKLQAAPLPSVSWTNPALDIWSYWLDACQRGILFLDVLQQRSKQYEEHAAKPTPHVLKFGVELVMDGRNLSRPVNYVLARVTPLRASRSTRRSGRSSSSIRALVTGPASVGSRPRARSAWRFRPATLAISSVFCRSP